LGHDSRQSHERPLFCATCGGKLAAEKDETHGWPCLACGRRSWLDPKVAACAVPHWDGKLVLVRRAIEPRYGFWVFPGGYCERGELPARAAERETLEEVGLQVRATDLVGIYSYEQSPVIVILYECDVLSREPPRALDECLEVRLFHDDEIPWDDLAFPSNRDGLRDLLARRGVRR
jgi:ADP-ribose pyrophosphatase YjhB (NUDIX family)